MIAALEDSREHDLAQKVRLSLEKDRQTRKARARSDTEQARHAKRARTHALTRAQAETMVAIREGKYPSWKPYTWTCESGNIHLRWAYLRATGGVSRMMGRLVGEGLLTEQHQLTEAGRARLAAWEARNGPIIPEDAVRNGREL